MLAPTYPGQATNHILREEQLMVGFNGDPSVQFMVITVGGNDQKAWGAQPGESTSRAMLVFFNSNGVQTGTFFFPNNPPQGGLSVLIASTNFARLPGAPIPDILIPPLFNPGSGKVSFRGNPSNPFRFDVTLSLSYGNFPANLTDGAGSPAPKLPTTGDATSLTRIQNFAFGNSSSQNADFALRPAVPINTRGQSFTFPVDGPEIDASLASIAFGGQNLVSGPTAARSVVISSRGTLNPLIITNIVLTGVNSNEFQITSGGGGTTLATGATRTVTLTFDPSTVGSKNAALRITSNDTNEMVTDVALTGLGIDPNAPDIDVSPTNADFGTRDMAAGAGASIGVLIRNTGAVGTLVISNVTLVGATSNDFRIFSDTAQNNLAPGASRALSMILSPNSAGPKTGTLRVVSNDPDEGTQLISLRGFAFDLNPCTAPNPTNSVAQDSCTNAMIACPGQVFTGVLPSTAPDGSSDCPSVGGDVWFQYTPSVSGTLTVNLQGIGMVPVLSAHSDCPGTAANQIACQSAAGASSTIAQLTLGVSAGTTMFLRVAAASSTPGSQFELALGGPSCFEFDRNRNNVTDTCESDFGSAPAPYPTTLAQNGARHRAFSGLFLGSRIDPNEDGSPSVGATGDKLDGPENDDDGVTFTSALTVGQAASLSVVASTNGFLNAWIDFNSDGDWADAGEQVITNKSLSVGPNALSINVPATAIVTNRTYARFRFNGSGNLLFSGAAADGEVEDYVIEVLPTTTTPSTLQVRITEVMAGYNGDSTVQFVELEVNGELDKAWGRQGSETVGRAMLTFFDEAGIQTGRFVFPSNAPSGGSTILVATRAFWEKTGLRPDFIMPPEFNAVGGKVAFQANPDNARFSANIALSYGGNRYFGLTSGAGPANTNELPLLGARSLVRTTDIPFGANQNSVFALSTPTPRNAAGQTATLSEAPLREQGRALFTRETFRGNGRTCATCHIDSGRDQFGLTPLTILSLSEDDPLFVFEHNVNMVKLILRSQPNDLRGPVTGTLGEGRILAGSGDTYFVFGGTNLAGIISDTNGNQGIFQSVSPGNLEGPTASNGSARGLEDHSLLGHGRGLILENIDGFKRREVFRASPHLLNIELSAPYGLSGEFSNLDDFSDGAVVQHFPRTLGRVSGVDFRHPTRAELAAMTTFMNGISQPANRNYDLDRFATTEAQKRGRTMFFNNEGKCSKCHSGPVLSLSDGSLPGSRPDVNENFNTGIANLLRNIADGLPTEPAGLPPGQSERAFNVPPLFGVRLTPPFFHDGSVPNLTEAVKFYDTEEFLQSPAGQLTGTMLAANRTNKVEDMVAFLESLVEIPVEFTRDVSFGIRCPGSPIPGSLLATVTNIGSSPIDISAVALNGVDASEFRIMSDSGQTKLAPGQTRSVRLSFNPTSPGGKHATLEFTAAETNLLGTFSFGVALFGGDVDNIVTTSPTALNFGTRDIDAPPSPEVSIIVTNNGSSELDVSGMTLTGATPDDFVVTADPSPLAPHDFRVIQVSFAPQRQGSKSATIRIPVLACNTTLVEIPLTGTASSSIHHFSWDAMAPTQYVGVPIPVRITAVDRNHDTVQAFSGTVKLSGVTALQTNASLVSPTNSGVFVNGVWAGTIVPQQSTLLFRLLARDSQGHTGLSEPITALLLNDLAIAATDSPDPLTAGQVLTYSLVVNNTGPADATGVIVTDSLPNGVRFLSGSSSQGQVVHSNGVVTCQLGVVTPATTASIVIQVEPNPGSGNGVLVNLAAVSRSEPESVTSNNVVTNTTTVGAFGILSVGPSTNFQSFGLSGGPFSPTNQSFLLSNAGTAPMTWQARTRDCVLPAGINAWWPLDGNAADVTGTNNGTVLGNPIFTNGIVGTAMLFDGIDDEINLRASPQLNIGTNDGFTIELWINPSDVTAEHPLVEWNNRQGSIAMRLILSVPSVGGSGSIFAGIDDVGGGSHTFATGSGIVVPNVWQHVALTYSRTSGVARILLNGTVVGQMNFGSFIVQSSFDVFLGRRFSTSGSTFRYVGLMDEVTLYARELSPDDIKRIFDAGASGKCLSQSGLDLSNCNTPPGLTAWWPFDGDTRDRSGTNAGVLTGGATFTTGIVGQTLTLDGNDDFVRIPASPELNVGLATGFTFESWINISDISRNDPIFEFSDFSALIGPHLWVSQGAPGSFFANLIDSNNGSHQIQSPGGLVVANTWQHVALTYSKTSGQVVFYVNGTAVHQQNAGSFTPKTTLDLLIGRRQSPGSNRSFRGQIDEPTIYNRDLTATEVRSIFLAGSSGKCSNRSWFSFSPLNGTLDPGMSTIVNVAITASAQRLAVGNYSEVISFTNTSNARGSTNRLVLLGVLNRAPSLAALQPVQMPEDSAARIITLAGITPGGTNETQSLTVSAFSSNPAVIANPIPVNYTSPLTTGILTLTPLTNAFGSATISVVVRDNGGTANGAIDAVTNAFVVTITPVNDPPSLGPIPNQIVDEGRLLQFTNAASDPDGPSDILTFEFLNPPPGVTLDAASGLVLWTPGEGQGPATNVFTIIVRDSGSPQLSATNQFTVRVLEVNLEPTLSPMADRVAQEGELLTFTITATDPDLPANRLTYGLGTGAPAGASINSTNGLFSWIAHSTAPRSTNAVTITVTDDGAPALATSQKVNVIVETRLNIRSITLSGANVILTWTSVPGTRYRVQFKNALTDTDWNDLSGEILTTGSTASTTDPISPTRRFYRVQSVP